MRATKSTQIKSIRLQGRKQSELTGPQLSTASRHNAMQSRLLISCFRSKFNFNIKFINAMSGKANGTRERYNTNQFKIIYSHSDTESFHINLFISEQKQKHLLIIPTGLTNPKRSDAVKLSICPDRIKYNLMWQRKFFLFQYFFSIYCLHLSHNIFHS